MDANGWTFIFKLEVNESAVAGTMQGINNDQTSTVKGKIKGKRIILRRDHFQEYVGYLLVDDPTGKTNELTIAEIFKSGEDQAGWYARRQRPCQDLCSGQCLSDFRRSWKGLLNCYR
jgi:hypothetical protein